MIYATAISQQTQVLYPLGCSWPKPAVLFRCWACLCSYGGTHFVLKKREKKDDSEPWNFWETFILGFRIKNLLSFIILYEKFQKKSNK